MFTERTSVGLDVHARSVAAAAIDGVTGELVQARLTPSPEHIRSRVQALPGPVAVSYKAGPTGFALYRMLTSAGIRCQVAAPSKLQKSAGGPPGPPAAPGRGHPGGDHQQAMRQHAAEEGR